MKKFRLFLLTFFIVLLNSTLNATVYEIGENNSSWTIYDNNPTGASVKAVDGVIVTSGDSTKNGYKLGNYFGREGAWENTTEFNIKWRMKFGERYYIYIRVQTNDGYRYLQYSNIDKDLGKRKPTSKYIHHGLGRDSADGAWHTFTRDLQSDLNEYDEGVVITSVNAFMIRGSGELDDIELFANDTDEESELGYKDYTLYEDAEDNNIDKWRIFDNKPAGASVKIVYDQSKNSHVVEINGTSTKNRVGLGNNFGRVGAWKDTKHFNISWDMSTTNRYYIYIRVQTNKGYRYLKYSNSDRDYGSSKSGRYIHHGLGKDSADGSWHTFVRDLQADLQDGRNESDNYITSVNSFSIRCSSVKLDNILLFNDLDDVTNEDVNVSASLIANYRFDECSWDENSQDVKDQTGNFNATAHNVTPVEGLINNGALFEGKDGEYIELPTLEGGFSKGITISAWVDFGTFENYERIVELSDGIKYNSNYGDVDNYISFHTEKGKLRFQSKVGGVNASTGPIVDIPSSGIHHYVATYDHESGKAKIYIDDELKLTVDWDKSKFAPDAVRDHNYIGRTVWGDSYKFEGEIDEVKIFNRALTADEIDTIYKNESVEKNYDGSDREAIECESDSNNDGTTNPNGDDGELKLVAEYRFDQCSYDGSTGEVVDTISGYNGTAQGSATTTADGKINLASQFNGKSDYIDMGNVLNPEDNDKVTISFWFKWDGKNSNRPNVIFSKENVYMAQVSYGYFRYAIKPHWNFDGGYTFPVTANEWTHAVITYDGNKQRLYKNGVKVYERVQSGKIGSSIYPFTIGAFKMNSYIAHLFSGSIDELKIYYSSLSDEQIKNIYDNESVGKNSDGSEREAVVCP